ncbi:LysM domain-containing protein OS=Streptomyces microflavus OX=1919 GN=Smic_73910 PE=3 SV=1 [Streptomyces microflavus]
MVSPPLHTDAPPLHTDAPLLRRPPHHQLRFEDDRGGGGGGAGQPVQEEAGHLGGHLLHRLADRGQGRPARERSAAVPDLIFPGQRLSLTPRGGDGASSRKPAPQAEKPAPQKKQAAPKTPERQAAEPRAEKPKAEPRKVEQRAAAPKAEPKKTEPKKAAPKQQKQAPAERAVKHSGMSAPVSASTGTAYRQAGSWSSGYHTGVDFPVPTGTSVKAVASGRVVSAGWAGAYGYEVVIRHEDGKYSQYAHLSALHVSEGQSVSGGQRIARSGSTGNSTGPHLHFEVRLGPGYGSDVDPLAYLRAGGVSV